MAVCGVKKQKEQVYAESKHLPPTAEDLVNEEGLRIADCPSETRVKVAKAIEANQLCYNCETGFHYMKQ